MNDIINAPKHYRHESGIECEQITADLPRWIGDAIGYIWRMDKKNQALDDRRKAHRQLGTYTTERLHDLQYIRATAFPGFAISQVLLTEPTGTPLADALLIVLNAHNGHIDDARKRLEACRETLQNQINTITNTK